MSKKSLALAGIAALALTGCDNLSTKTTVKGNTTKVCKTLQNLYDVKKENDASYININWKWFTTPFITVCTTNIEEKIIIRTEFGSSRSSKYTWDKILYSINEAPLIRKDIINEAPSNIKNNIQKSSNKFFLAPKNIERKRTFVYTPEDLKEEFKREFGSPYKENIKNVRYWIPEYFKPTLKIKEKSFVVWNASPESFLPNENWRDIINWTTGKNVNISLSRAQETRSDIIKALEGTWIEIKWKENFEIKDNRVLEIEGYDSELGFIIKSLYESGDLNGNDPIKDLLQKAKKDELQNKELQKNILKILDEKRYAEAELILEWYNLNTNVESAKAINILILIFIMLSLAGSGQLYLSCDKRRKRKENNKRK